MKSASQTSAGCAGLLEMTHPSGRFHRCTLLCPRAGIGRVGEVLVGALPVPHLPSGVARIPQDRCHRAQRPRRTGAMRIPAQAGRGRARNPRLAQRPRDARDAVPGKSPGEDPPNDMRCPRIGL
jgi:hypothetical protein